LPTADEVIEALLTMSLFFTNYMRVAAIGLASSTLAIFPGCSSATEPPPDVPAGTGGVPAATGGVPNATGGVPNATGGTTGGGGSAPVGGASGGGGGAPVGGASAGAGAGGGPPAGPPGDPVQGKIVYAQCTACHAETAAGGLGPNITGSVTAGIGSWSEAEFNRVIREGVDRTGQKLCVLMSVYPATSMSDVQLRDLYAYLRTLSNDTPNRGSGCP
jgi:hypothetical protein